MEVHRPEKRSMLATPKQACTCPGRDVTHRAGGRKAAHPSEPRGDSSTAITIAPSHQRLPPSATLTAHYLDRGTGLSSPKP